MGNLTAAKARKILHDKEVKGHLLSEKQRGFFGARASGQPVMLAKMAKKLRSKHR